MLLLRLKLWLLRWLIRDRIENYRWTDVIMVYVDEHRKFYTEENRQTAIDSITMEVKDQINVINGSGDYTKYWD